MTRRQVRALAFALLGLTLVLMVADRTAGLPGWAGGAYSLTAILSLILFVTAAFRDGLEKGTSDRSRD